MTVRLDPSPETQVWQTFNQLNYALGAAGNLLSILMLAVLSLTIPLSVYLWRVAV